MKSRQPAQPLQHIELNEKYTIFFDKTPGGSNIGRASFYVCAIWKRRRIDELIITPHQQRNIWCDFVIRTHYSDGFDVDALGSILKPPYFGTQWCKYHKAVMQRFGTPINANCFTVNCLSCISIYFSHKTFDKHNPMHIHCSQSSLNGDSTSEPAG